MNTAKQKPASDQLKCTGKFLALRNEEVEESAVLNAEPNFLGRVAPIWVPVLSENTKEPFWFLTHPLHACF